MNNRSQSGFSLVGSIITVALFGLLAVAVANASKQQLGGSSAAKALAEKTDIRRFLSNKIDCRRTILNQIDKCDTSRSLDLYSSSCEKIPANELESGFIEDYSARLTCKKVGQLYELMVEGWDQQRHSKESTYQNVFAAPVLCDPGREIYVDESCRSGRNGSCSVSFPLSSYGLSSTSMSDLKFRVNFGNGFIPDKCGTFADGISGCYCRQNEERQVTLPVSGDNTVVVQPAAGKKWFSLSARYSEATETIRLDSGAGGWGDCAGNPCNACISDIYIDLSEQWTCP